jgi:nitrate/nitrite transport system permease protein
MNANVKIPAPLAQSAPPTPGRARRMATVVGLFGLQRLLPPVVILAVLGLLWELLCSGPGVLC